MPDAYHSKDNRQPSFGLRDDYNRFLSRDRLRLRLMLGLGIRSGERWRASLSPIKTMTNLIYPSGQQVVVNHDDKGRMQSLTDDFENPYLSGMTYNLAGHVTGLTLGNGVVESYGYDGNRLQLTTQTATKSGNQLMNLTYNYQATAGQMGQGSTAGNAAQLMGITGTMNSTTESAGYTYDLLGRLVTSTQSSNGASPDRQFVYDRWGNRTQVYDGLPGGKETPDAYSEHCAPAIWWRAN